MAAPLLYLASQSPRRRELLAQINLTFEIIEVDVDETRSPNETSQDYVMRLAKEKAYAGVTKVKSRAPILGADTIITLDGQIYGKPADQADALRMWQHLAGQTHQVLTAVAIVAGDRCEQCLVQTRVQLCQASEAQWRAYWKSGEPKDKAGGYAIQGKGAVFIQRIEGSYSNVVGLPLYETAQLLARIGISL
ncbi:MAG: Maf-like protein [Gammaproteobacteria bacterium]|nr:Maf-like protein [Gammaproteobacteria bacterium]